MTVRIALGTDDGSGEGEEEEAEEEAEDVPKTKMFCELDTVNAHAAPGPSEGSLYAVLGMKGAGGTGFGWK